MALPGPEAQQLASYVGYSMYGVRGAITAGGLFVLPSFVLLCGMSVIYVEYGEVAEVAGIVRGLGAAVIALVAAAVLRIGGRVIHTRAAFVMAAVAFGLIVAGLPFPLIIAVAALVGYLASTRRPGLLGKPSGHGGEEEEAGDSFRETGLRRRFVKTLLLWLVPLAALLLVGGLVAQLAASSRSPPSSRSAAHTRCSPSWPTRPSTATAGSQPTTWSPVSRWASRRRGR